MKSTELYDRLKESLQITDEELNTIIPVIAPSNPQSFFKTDPNATILRTEIAHLLDALIELRRGPSPGRKASTTLTNNDVLKKMRILLNYHDEAVLDAFELGGANMSVYEVRGLFRSNSNKHFRQCSDDLLLQFLDGVITLGLSQP